MIPFQNLPKDEDFMSRLDSRTAAISAFLSYGCVRYPTSTVGGSEGFDDFSVTEPRDCVFNKTTAMVKQDVLGSSNTNPGGKGGPLNAISNDGTVGLRI